MLLGSSTAGCCTAVGTTVEKQITNLLESIYFIFNTHWQVEIGYYRNCETQETVDTNKTCISGMLMCCKGEAHQAWKNLACTKLNLQLSLSAQKLSEILVLSPPSLVHQDLISLLKKPLLICESS